jgi:hypothetical protein
MTLKKFVIEAGGLECASKLGMSRRIVLKDFDRIAVLIPKGNSSLRY